MKVLIADDDPISRKLLQSYLQKWGCEVTAAENGAEAWSSFQGDEFPIVITDWMMPELDGVELVRRIRSGPRPGYVYVILLTAKGQKEDLVAGMDAGADDFLTKPFDRDELRVRLRAGERIVELEQQARAAAGLVGAAPELERRLSEVADGLRGLLADRSGLHEDLARRLDHALAELQQACDRLRKAASAGPSAPGA
jgi:DNA-binding response OmpR family regulator